MSEETTIDTLQIEIQTSSTNAAVGIRDLAKSLGELKANGTIGVATKNLKALSEALRGFADASNVTRSLGKLSGAMERLKSIGSVANIANGIKKLNENLRGIDNINIDNIAPQIERIAGALAPLSAVKAGGISTMMNGLKKLGEVTKSLDDDTIAAFTQKVQKLNEVLAPLSEKMTTLQGGFRGINSAIRQTSVSVQQANAEVNVSVFNLSNMINVIQGVIQALNVVVQKLTEAIGMAIEWDGIAARFGRGFGAQAEETYAWIQRLNEEMGINIQQFMQYSSVYATMLTGFGVAMEDAGKMALGYTELTYDIWAGYNDVYNNFSDAAEAVKSAIAGEVEPIRRAGFTIVESTLEQTAANHGLSISIEKATEAQKSYLRYLTLVDQAQAQGLVGTYAKELQTAEGLMRTFSQQLKSLSQAFGSLFLPILVRVMPWLQAFVDLLTDAVYAIAAFFGVEIQKVDWSGYGEGSGAIDNVADSANTATGALNSATKAAKELKNATLGIDELNVISPPTASSGSGGAGGGAGGGSGFGGLDVDSLWDESIFDHVQNQVDEIKEKIKDMLPTVAALGIALAGLRLAGLLDDLDLSDTKFAKFDTKIKGLSKGLSVASIAIAVGALVWDFTGAYLEDGNWASFFGALGTTAIGAGLAYKFAGKGGLGFTLLVSGVAMLGRLVFDLAEGTVDFGDSETWITMLGGSLQAAIGGIFTWKVLGPAITKAWTAFAPKVAQFLASKGGWIGAIAAAVISMIYFLTENFAEVKEAFTGWWDENIKPTLDAISQEFAVLIEELQPLIDLVKPLFVVIRDFLSEIDFGGFFGDLIEGIGGIVFALSSFPITQTIADIVDAVKNMVSVATGAIQVVKGLYGIIKALFTGEDIMPALEKTWNGIVNIFDGFLGAVVDPLKNFYDGVVAWFTKLWDTLVGHSKVPDTINAIVDWFVSLPGKIFSSIENFVKGIIGKFQGLWNDLVSWWNSKKELKQYTPSIGSIKDKLSSAWTTAKNWWNNTKEALKSYTPSIGSIYDKLKPRWDNAKEWWDKKKSAMKQYTPNIGSIYEKAKERWDNARDWWNKKKAGMNSYTPSIGSIKDKIVSAWNTAKKWWNSNAKLSTKLNVSVPKIEVKWDTASAFGKSFKYPTGFKLKFAADGGIFDQGSLVWAGERGPEVLAKAAGGRTGVMNVQQMQDAVYEGVYAAVVAAMSAMGGNGGSQPVNVYLDGRQITSAVERRQRERGASIMGNQVYSY